MAKALIVEDEDNIIPHIEDALTARGDTFHRAQSLEEARRLLQSNLYDYILLDLKIPAREGGPFPHISYGVELLKEIRRTKKNERTAVIAMTSYHRDCIDVATELFVIGVNDCIPKPFDEKRPLVKVIGNVLRHYANTGRTDAFGKPAENPAEPQSFVSGEMVFFPD